MNTADLVFERTYSAPPEKLWRAMTEQALLADWLMSNDFRAEVGRAFTLRAKPQGHWDGVVKARVLDVQPVTSLSYSWATADLDTIVTWHLEPTATGTRLTLTQSGFRVENGRNRAGAAYGWPRFLDALGRLMG